MLAYYTNDATKAESISVRFKNAIIITMFWSYIYYQDNSRIQNVENNNYVKLLIQTLELILISNLIIFICS